jgi:hypothetical protein
VEGLVCVKLNFRKTALLALVLIGLGSLAFIFNLALESFIQSKIESLVAKSCETCHLEIQNVDDSIFNPGHLILHDLHFTSGEKGSSEVDAKAESITIDFSPTSLLSKKILIYKITSEKLTLLYVNGDRPSKKSSTENDDATYFFQIDESELHYGEFKYIRNHQGTSATLHLHDIEIHLDKLGNTEELKQVLAKAKICQRIENSGETKVQIAALIFKRPLDLDVAMQMSEQNLNDLTPFFKKNAGVNLEGILTKGHAEVSVRGAQLHALVQIQYDGLKIKVDPNYDRSPTAAFFTNLATAVGVQKKNLDANPSEQIQPVDLTREAGETLVSFILRGIKEGALKVSTGGLKK